MAIFLVIITYYDIQTINAIFITILLAHYLFSSKNFGDFLLLLLLSLLLKSMFLKAFAVKSQLHIYQKVIFHKK